MVTVGVAPLIGLDTGHLMDPRWRIVARWLLNWQHGAQTWLHSTPSERLHDRPFVVYVRLCYTSNHNQTGQAIIYPKAWAVPTSEKDQSSPGTQVSHCSRGQKLVACQLWFVTTYVSRLLPRQRASFNISVGSKHKHLTLLTTRFK